MITLLLFITSALIRGPVEYSLVFEVGTALAGSGILLPLRAGVNAFVADVGL